MLELCEVFNHSETQWNHGRLKSAVYESIDRDTRESAEWRDSKHIDATAGLPDREI